MTDAWIHRKKKSFYDPMLMFDILCLTLWEMPMSHLNQLHGRANNFSYHGLKYMNPRTGTSIGRPGTIALISRNNVDVFSSLKRYVSESSFHHQTLNNSLIFTIGHFFSSIRPPFVTRFPHTFVRETNKKQKTETKKVPIF